MTIIGTRMRKDNRDLAAELRLCQEAIEGAACFFDTPIGFGLAGALIRGDTPDQWDPTVGRVRGNGDTEGSTLPRP